MAIKVLIVVGARPNFMKAAPIIRAIGEHNRRNEGAQIRHLLVHTGQHYDALMSDQFFIDLDLPKPDVHLGVGSGSQAAQTAEILEKFEQVLARECPDVVIVVGDVNSTLACALATAKLTVAPKNSRPLLAHVEAGLRSFDRRMPEEINRIVTDHLADLLFVTEKSGVANLRREGISSEKIFFVGNTMIDSLLAFKDRADKSRILDRLDLCAPANGNGKRATVKPYALLTLHRPSNVDDLAAFQNVLEGISELREQLEIILPVHPRTRKRIGEFGLERYFEPDTALGCGRVRLIEPLGYLDFLCLMKNAHLVLTDSGGVQEETTCLGVPCVTLRENTERPVTVRHGTNIIGGTSAERIRNAVAGQISRKVRRRTPEKWDGKAAGRIVSILANTVDHHPGTEGPFTDGPQPVDPDERP
ncbi:MAG: UDP-N-acetylglucosamine 2-epimerase (non-hydrolyzing) [Candidatus Acidiferrales bacterium]